MSTYREAPLARALESAWARRARQAKRVARWPLDHVRMWHIVAALTLGPAAALITFHCVWIAVLKICAGIVGIMLGVFVLVLVLACVQENWKRPISKWRWPS